MQPALERRIAGLDLLHQTAVVAAGPVGLCFKSLGALLALGDALEAPLALLLAQCRAFMGGQGAHHIAIKNLAIGVGLLKILDGAGIGLSLAAAADAVGTGLSVGWRELKHC